MANVVTKVFPLKACVKTLAMNGVRVVKLTRGMAMARQKTSDGQIQENAWACQVNVMK